jgi:hypothetical protein
MRPTQFGKAEDRAPLYTQECVTGKLTVGPLCKFCQVELYLIPAIIQAHRHRADEVFHSCLRLIIACTKTAPHILIVQNRDLKTKISLEVFHLRH